MGKFHEWLKRSKLQEQDAPAPEPAGGGPLRAGLATPMHQFQARAERASTHGTLHQKANELNNYLNIMGLGDYKMAKRLLALAFRDRDKLAAQEAAADEGPEAPSDMPPQGVTRGTPPATGREM